MTDHAPYNMASLVLGCESEQLHLSGAIQGWGALIVARAEPPHLITHVSANLADYLGLGAADLLDQPLDRTGCLNASHCQRLDARPGHMLRLPRQACVADQASDVVLVRGEHTVLIELEQVPAGAEPIPLQELQKPFLSIPGDEAGIDAVHDSLVEAIQTITGYDRVMVYRFHEDWSGEVIAEATSDALGSYLGLRFPASDIPAIARNLYLNNPCRMIPEVAAPAVPLVGLDAAPPDLTWSGLRSVSPVHLQYLTHMGVGASFSLPIVISGRLWGLVACHHLNPRRLHADQRQASVSISRAYALCLTSYLASRRLQMIDSLERRVDRVLEAFCRHADPLDGLEAVAPQIMEALGAHGVALALGDDVAVFGHAPDMANLSLIDHWFLNQCQDSLYHTDRLASLLPDHPEIAERVSGLFAVKANSPRRGWLRLYWFRDAEPREVAWAGNPNKPTVEHAGVPMLSPRRSFEKWVEIMTDHSRPWKNEERMIAGKFRNTLLRWL